MISAKRNTEVIHLCSRKSGEDISSTERVFDSFTKTGDISESKKKNDVNAKNKVYNPLQDDAIICVLKDFEGASVVGFREVDT